MIRYAAIAVAVLTAMGCTSQQTWTAVKVERRRIATEAKKLVPKEQWDTFDTIVYDRPRTRPESIVTGVENATTRINRERIEYAAAEEEHRQLILAIAQKRYAPNINPSEVIPASEKRLSERANRIKLAQRLCLIADASQSADDFLPVLDLLVHDILGSGSRLSPRAIPEPERLRYERCREWFGAWNQRFLMVQP